MLFLIRKNVSLLLSSEKQQCRAHEVRKSCQLWPEHGLSHSDFEHAFEQPWGAEAGQPLSLHYPDFIVLCVVTLALSTPNMNKWEFERPLIACGKARYDPSSLFYLSGDTTFRSVPVVVRAGVLSLPRPS